MIYVKPITNTFYSRDITDETGDGIRHAIGCYFTKVEDTPTADSLLAPVSYQPMTLPDTIEQHEYGTTKEALVQVNDKYAEDGPHQLMVGSWQVNPFRTSMIDYNAYVPNFKIPLRLTANIENSKGDKLWNVYFMGGEFADRVYTPLIDENAVRYSTKFTVSLPYSKRFLTVSNFELNDEALHRGGMYSVKANFNEYDENVNSRIEYEKEISEMLLPNYSITRDFIAENARPWKFYESGMTIGAEAYNPQKLSVYKWFMQNDIDATLAGSLTVTDYYGVNWPKLWSLDGYAKDSKEEAERSQQNLIFDQYYFDYYFVDEPETPTSDTKESNLLKSSDAYNITFGFLIMQDQAHQDPPEAGAPPAEPLEHSEMQLTPPRSATDSPMNFNFIRDIIETNNFSSKFLEILKDIDEGSLEGFPQQKQEYSVESEYSYLSGDTTMTVVSPEDFTPLVTEKSELFAPTANIVKKQSYLTFDFLEMLAYIRNNPSQGINDNYHFMGMSEIQHHTPEASNTLFRYMDMSSLLGVFDQSIDLLEQYYKVFFEAKMQSKHYKHEDRLIEDPKQFTADISDAIFNCAFNHDMSLNNFTNVLGYKVEKYEATPIGQPASATPLQKFWFFNSRAAPKYLEYKDTQVKFGKEYVYRGTAYVAVITNKYRYSNLRLTKQIGKYTSKEADESGASFMRANLNSEAQYCLEFYDPYTEYVSDQTFEVAGTEIGEYTSTVTYQTTDLASINIMATNAQEISRYPQLADMYLNVQPCIRVVEVPMFEKSCGVYDNPPMGISAEPFHFLDDSKRLGFSLQGQSFKPYFYPVAITQRDQHLKNRYLNSRELGDLQFVESFSQSPARYIEVFRIDKMPTSYSDFENALVSTIDLRIPGEEYNLNNHIMVDKVLPNKKYYYLFRFVSEAGMPSWPTPVIESELVDDGGYIYSLFEHIDSAQFITDPYENVSVKLRKLFHLEPNVEQLQFDDYGADYSQPANTQLSSVKVGVSDDPIWDKMFKIRLTSKKTGKKIDINVSYEMEQIDMTSQTDSHIPSDEAGPIYSFTKSTKSL